MPSAKPQGGQKLKLVQETAARLRERILAVEPDAQIGSLTELSQQLDVGIVTVQQAARILEHEGLLAVRRGPGGGYYGRRPDETSLARALAAYLRVHGFDYLESQEMLALLDCDIFPAAARCENQSLHRGMRAVHARVDACDTAEQRIAVEEEMRRLLYQMVNRPLLQFLGKVTGRLYEPFRARDPLFAGDEGVATWKLGRKRMLQAILEKDEALAGFEAERYRQEVLKRIRQREASSGTRSK